MTTQGYELEAFSSNTPSIVKKCHFCVIVNQWCSGSGTDGKPDDCIQCGKCELRQEGTY